MISLCKLTIIILLLNGIKSIRIFCSSTPFDRNSYAEYFYKSFCLTYIAVPYCVLTTLFPMILMGSCMCYEASINDLIETLKVIGSLWEDVEIEDRLDVGIIMVIEYQIDCVT